VRRPLLAIAPEPRLAVLIALLAPAWLLPGAAGRVAIGVILSAIGLAVLVDTVALPARSDIVVERMLPASVGIGDHLEGEYVVRSRWGLPLRARLEDDLPPGVTGGAGELELDIPAHGSTELAVPVAGAVRGD
jgi:hypothetical protein